MGSSLQPAQYQKGSPDKFVRGTSLFDPDANGQAWYLSCKNTLKRRVDCMNTNLRYLAASRVDTPVGDLHDVVVLSPSEEQLGTLSGVLVDPQERRLCYFIVESGHWLGRRQHLVPAGFARVAPQRKALYLDVESDRFHACEQCHADRLPPFSDEDVITAMFAPQHAN